MEQSTRGSLPPSVWGVVGNIVAERPFGPGGNETRRGTRLFRAGAKIYLASVTHSGFIFPNDSGFPASVLVVGQHRKSRDWITSWVRTGYTTNWRVQLIYDPPVLSRLWEQRWPGFLLAEGDFTWPVGERAGEEPVNALLEKVASAHPRSAMQAEALSAVMRLDGWIRCPRCGRAFATYDKARWNGLRHATCGQRIDVIEPERNATS